MGCNNLNLDSVSYSRIELTGSESEIISDEINIYKDSIDISLDNVIGFSDRLYTKADYDSKNFNSTLGNLVADIIYIQSDSLFRVQENKKIDFVIQNHGGIRAALPKGDVKLSDAYKILPFENEIVIVEMDGESINEIVNYFINGFSIHFNDYNLIFKWKYFICIAQFYITFRKSCSNSPMILNNKVNFFIFLNPK